MDIITYRKATEAKEQTDKLNNYLDVKNVERTFFTGDQSDDYRLSINDVTLKFVTSSKVWSVIANIENRKSITITKEASTRFIVATAATMPENNVSIIRTVDVGGITETSYSMTVQENEKYLLIVYYHDNDTIRDRETIKDSVHISESAEVAKRLEDIESEVNTEKTEIANIKSMTLSTLPSYVVSSLSYRPVGELSKGYILMTFDDGAAELATYTIPTLISKQVPATFGLFSTCACVVTPAYLETLLGAVGDYGCCVAQHGARSFSRYTEAQLNAFFDTEASAFNTAGITEICGSICPGETGYEDTSTLIQAVAGGRFGAVFSGGEHGEIGYGTFDCTGPRTNIFAMPRQSGKRLTSTTLITAVDYAYDNHLIFCPFWHDEVFTNEPDTKTVFEALIDYAKTKGLEFITMKDLPSIV